MIFVLQKQASPCICNRLKATGCFMCGCCAALYRWPPHCSEQNNIYVCTYSRSQHTCCMMYSLAWCLLLQQHTLSTSAHYSAGDQQPGRESSCSSMNTLTAHTWAEELIHVDRKLILGTLRLYFSLLAKLYWRCTVTITLINPGNINTWGLYSFSPLRPLGSADMGSTLSAAVCLPSCSITVTSVLRATQLEMKMCPCASERVEKAAEELSASAIMTPPALSPLSTSASAYCVVAMTTLHWSLLQDLPLLPSSPAPAGSMSHLCCQI